MSPESFGGKRNAQTDIWSVGVVLYQLLKGKLPFSQEHPSERMFAILTKEFEPLTKDIPESFRDVVNKALEKQPQHRYQTACEMRDDLQRFLRNEIDFDFPKFEPAQSFSSEETQLIMEPSMELKPTTFQLRTE